MSLLASTLALSVLAAPASEPAAADDRCTWISLTDDPSVPIEDMIYTADTVGVARALARIIDRLESRACFDRSNQLFDRLDRRLAELGESGEDVSRLQARVDLIRIRVDLRQSCADHSCERAQRECPALDRLRAFILAHPELEPDEIESWLVAEQSDPERLRCLLAAAYDDAPPPRVNEDDPPSKPPLLGVDVAGPQPTDPRWTPSRRRTAIGLSSAGIVLGAAAMVAGGVMLALDERCPGGAPANSCEFRYSTTEEGALALGLGGAALIGSSIGLTFSIVRKPTATGATVWGVGLGYTGRF